MSSLLKITDLHVSVADTPILKGVNMEIRQGEIHALMGPNGSGKSTLAYALAGHPNYQITGGVIEVDGTDITELEADEGARLGLFLAFQYPVVIPGVKVADFIRHAISNVRNPDRKEGEGLVGMREFRKEMKTGESMEYLVPGWAYNHRSSCAESLYEVRRECPARVPYAGNAAQAGHRTARVL